MRCSTRRASSRRRCTRASHISRSITCCCTAATASSRGTIRQRGCAGASDTSTQTFPVCTRCRPVVRRGSKGASAAATPNFCSNWSPACVRGRCSNSASRPAPRRRRCSSRWMAAATTVTIGYCSRATSVRRATSTRAARPDPRYRRCTPSVGRGGYSTRTATRAGSSRRRCPARSTSPSSTRTTAIRGRCSTFFT